MSFVINPMKRLKWGFIPRKRIVEEFGDSNDTSIDEVVIVEENGEIDEKKSVSTDNNSSEKNLDRNDVEIEYRDEKNRKWWKFFDEYEYRVNKNVRSKHKWYKWFNETDTPAERKLIMKLDILLTFYSLMAYWVKYLDQTNLNNAYIGGMKEGLGMEGNDLVNTQVMFNVGNIVFQIPFMYLLYAAPLNFVLPSLDICWSILTVCLFRSGNVKGLKAIRFFIGAFEAPSYLAYQYLFGSWYKVDEIARRSMVYYFGQYLGLLTSGLLSGAIEDSLNGKNGLAAWQWIFIVDGIVSIAVGVIGFYLLPGTPSECYSIFLTDDEIRLARSRLKENKTEVNPKKNVSDLFDLDLWKSILSSWEIYVLSLWNMFCWNNNNGSSGAYALWIDSLHRYGEGEKQRMTSLTPGLGLIWLLLTCCYADLFHSRWLAIIFSQVFNLTGNIILAVWNVPERSKWFAWCLQYFGWAMAPVLYSWQNDICRRDARKRAVILVSMNILAQASTAWMSVIVWKTVEAPRYLKGFTFTACCAFLLCLWTFVVLYFYKRTEKKHAKDNGIILYNSDKLTESDPEMIQIKTQDNK